MVTEKSGQMNGTKLFTFEDNVLKGMEFKLETHYTNFADVLLDKMKESSTEVAQIDGMTEEEDTFAQLRERTIKCAAWLRKQGIQRDDIIAVCTHNHFNSLVPCMAALCVGAVFNPWDPEMNTQAARHFLTLSQPKIIFANEASIQTVLEAIKIERYKPQIIVFGEVPGIKSFSSILESEKTADIDAFKCTVIEDPHSNAAILYSSGTTGPAKGVQLSHFALLYQTSENNGFALSGVSLWFSSLYWISGVLLSFRTITVPTAKLIYPIFDEETTCKLIEKFKVSWVFVGTSMIIRLVKSGYLRKYDLSSLKLIFTGGSTLKQSVQDKIKSFLPNTQVLQAFGMTELCGLATNQLPNNKSGSCGVPSRGIQLKVIDVDTGSILGPNQQGELCIKSDSMTKGYYKNPEATKNTIDSEGWLHSGDLVYYDEDGELFVIDRLKELIKVREHQVSPCDVEIVLQSHPEVVEVAVIGVPHSIDGEHPIAFISRVPGGHVTEKELTEMVANNLSEYHQLRAGVKFMECLPHTPSGKIARRDLKIIAKSYAV